jgi:hypothetical protein
MSRKRIKEMTVDLLRNEEKGQLGFVNYTKSRDG